ncbi:MAG TPA: hypothetical protein DEP36_15905 [Gammaproteobacteria bacterium]|nr:hypothetical protein [Gammaproteobacteria bacterium]
MTFKTLTELANLYGTDKGTIGPTPEWEPHNYTDIYEAYLARHRQSAITILEIGLGVTGPQWETTIVQGRNTGGASVKMWHDYFPKARIVGIDVNPCPYLDNDRIRTFVADQGNPEDLQAIVEAAGGIEFDVIIDDGSHRPDHQQVSFSVLFKRLKAGGLYFIEDLLANGFGDHLSSRHANDSVRNTRSVLKHFQQTGNFLEPNALIDPDALKAQMASLTFHAPKPWVDNVRYPADTEQICVITKKPAPRKPSLFSWFTSRGA